MRKFIDRVGPKQRLYHSETESRNCESSLIFFEIMLIREALRQMQCGNFNVGDFGFRA